MTDASVLMAASLLDGADRIAFVLRERPSWSPREVARELGVTPGIVSMLRARLVRSERLPRQSPATLRRERDFGA